MTKYLERTERPDIVAKITKRLLPFLGIIYLIAYIDRQNVGYAKLQMVGDLGISEYAYGLGASLFFIGYFIFEVPSNVILERVGARRWFTRIMISWGAVTIALAFTQNTVMFFILRFLLGACEAGFYPGVLYLLTIWFPEQYRARMVGSFMFYSAIANAVGAPLGGSLLSMDGLLDMRGWQWLFIVTGLPAVIAGVVTLYYLDDRPEQARFLSDDEKAWLKTTLAREGENKQRHAKPLRALLDRRVIMLALWHVTMPLGAYGISYWLPTIVKSFGVTNFVNGWINVIPWAFVALALWTVPKIATRIGRPSLFVAGPLFVGAVCLALSVAAPSNPLKLALITIAAAGIFSAQPTFWTLPTRFLTGASAAAGLACINSVGNLGGFIAQNLVPWVYDHTGSLSVPMLFLAAFVLLGAIATFPIERALRQSEKAEGTTGI